MYGKLFASMYDGTLATKGPWQALVTFQQLLILSDRHGVVDMTADALARRTTIPLEIIKIGLAALEEADGESRNPAEGGRRIVRLAANRSWGWRIVNYAHYRRIQSAEQRNTYMRNFMRGQRADEAAVSAVVSRKQQTLAQIGQAEAEVEAELPVGTDPNTTLAPKKGSIVERAKNARSTTPGRARRRSAASNGAGPPADDAAGAAGTALVVAPGALVAALTGAGTRKRTVETISQSLGTVFAEIAAGTRDRISADELRARQAQLVFLFWTLRFNHPSAILDPKRKRTIIARLKENEGDVSELLYALDGAMHDGWIMGTDADSTKKYDDLRTILRDRGQVERFANTRQRYRAGEPHKLIPKLEAAMRGDGAVHDGPPPADHGAQDGADAAPAARNMQTCI